MPTKKFTADNPAPTDATTTPDADGNTLTMRDLLAILPQLVAEMKKPAPDPKAEAREAEAKRQWAATHRAAAERKVEAEKRCGHYRARRGGNRTYSVLWHRYADGFYRGVCTQCQKKFAPETLSSAEYRRWTDTTLDAESASGEPVNYRARQATLTELAKSATWNSTAQ